MLIDLSDRNNLGGGGSGGGGSGGTPQPPGFVGYPQAPALPPMPMPPTNAPFNYPNMGGFGGGGATAPPFNYNIPPNQEKKDLNINTHFLNVSSELLNELCEICEWKCFFLFDRRKKGTFIHQRILRSVQTIIFR